MNLFPRWCAIALTLFWAVSADRVEAQTFERVRLGISDVSFTFLPHLIAKDTGIFHKRGLNVEVIFPY